MSTPRVSIGLPIYNGARYLAADLPIFIDPRAWDAFVRYRAARGGS